MMVRREGKARKARRARKAFSKREQGGQGRQRKAFRKGDKDKGGKVRTGGREGEGGELIFSAGCSRLPFRERFRRSLANSRS
jgi:hypothetical protein